jgi:hypothetical protein
MSGSVKFNYWQEDDMWLGYLQDYPDYWTQGASLEDLQEHLADIYADINVRHIPCVRKEKPMGFDENRINAVATRIVRADIEHPL